MPHLLKLVALIVTAAFVASFFVPPALYQGLTLPSDILTSLVNTIVSASIASALVFPFAVLLGFYVSRRGLGILLPFMMFTTAIPHTAIGLLLLPLFTALNLVDTSMAVVLTMSAVSLPLGVSTISSGFSTALRSLDEFLTSMGIGESRNILIHLRAAKTVAAISLLLMWLRAFSELGALLIVANRPVTVGVYLFELFNRGGAAFAVPYSLVVALIGLSFSFLLYFASNRLEG